MDITETLKEIGLEEREIKVYLAVLELGESTVLPIARKANIKRTYCYDILDMLQKKGLVTYFEKNNRRRYTADDPTKLQDILKQRLDHFGQILPELRSIYNQPQDKPKVRFYEGKEMALQVAKELSQSKAYDAISSPDHLIKFLGANVIEELAQQAIKKGIHARELYTRGGLPVSWGKYFKKPLMEIRYLPEGITMTSDIILYQNKLALISYGTEMHGIIIEGSGIVDAHKALFEMLWQTTPSIS